MVDALLVGLDIIYLIERLVMVNSLVLLMWCTTSLYTRLLTFPSCINDLQIAYRMVTFYLFADNTSFNFESKNLSNQLRIDEFCSMFKTSVHLY